MHGTIASTLEHAWCPPPHVVCVYSLESSWFLPVDNGMATATGDKFITTHMCKKFQLFVHIELQVCRTSVVLHIWILWIKNWRF